MKNRFIKFPLTTQEIRNKPLHGEPGQKPGQPGKAWPGRAFHIFGQAYQGNAAWASLATAKCFWQPWPQKSGFLGHVNSKDRLSWQPWPKKTWLPWPLRCWPDHEVFLDFQALKSSLQKPSIFGHVVPEKMYLIQLMLHFSQGVKVVVIANPVIRHQRNSTRGY